MPRVRFPAPLDGLAEAYATYSHCPLMDIIITLGLMPIVDDAVSVTVRLEPFAHRWSVWSGHQVRLWCSCGLLFHAQQL